jgi:hypothetical protein
MKQSHDHFILTIPRLFIKQYPYAWFPLVVLWTWPPNISIVFLAIIVIGLLLLRWQSAAWISHMRREHAGMDGKFYVDRPAIPWGRAVRNIAILFTGGGLIAFLIKDQIGLTFWQVFLIGVGFMLTYQDMRFFGSQRSISSPPRGSRFTLRRVTGLSFVLHFQGDQPHRADPIPKGQGLGFLRTHA